MTTLSDDGYSSPLKTTKIQPAAVRDSSLIPSSHSHFVLAHRKCISIHGSSRDYTTLFVKAAAEEDFDCFQRCGFQIQRRTEEEDGDLMFKAAAAASPQTSGQRWN